MALTIILTLVVGIIQLVLGIIKIGFITNLLSRPVITGFAATVAVIIGISQMKHLLGVLTCIYTQLGRIKDHHKFRNVKRFDELEVWQDVINLRVGASLSYINIQFFKDYVDTVLKGSAIPIKTIILDTGPISLMDATAVNGINETVLSLNEKNIRFLIC